VRFHFVSDLHVEMFLSSLGIVFSFVLSLWKRGLVEDFIMFYWVRVASIPFIVCCLVKELLAGGSGMVRVLRASLRKAVSIVDV
jgi:hypothetical protein